MSKQHAGSGRTGLRIATIVDPLTESLLRGAVDAVPLLPFVWRDQLREPVDGILVESAWLGHGGMWRYEISHCGTRGSNHLLPIVERATELGLPTVFWNKEDPVWFPRFFAATAGFETVATTDEEAAPWYRDLRPDAKVTTLPFQINPGIHHPVRPGPELTHPDRVLYAGSLGPERHRHRRERLEQLLGWAADRDLLDIAARPGASFPQRFERFIVGSFDASELPGIAKQYAAVLNVNTVETSSTMLSRRVVEALGAGVPVISTPSAAIRHLYGTGVFEVETAAAFDEALSEVTDPSRRGALSAAAWRHAHRNFSIDDALIRLFRPDPIKQSAPRDDDAALCQGFAPGRAIATDESGAGRYVRLEDRAGVEVVVLD